MAEKSLRGRSQDRAKVAGKQEHELRYEAEKMGVSQDDVREAVVDAGNSRKAVEAELDRK